MSAGAVMNYDFGPKRHWRRWVWNRISERVENKRDAVVLYLAGAGDFDRPLAKSKGFIDNNLLAIERSSVAVDALRDAGVNTISSELKHAMRAVCISGLGVRHGVQVVHADLCNGLTSHNMRMFTEWLYSPALKNAVFSINLLRGRDPESNKLREHMGDELGKHRGKQMLNALLGAAAADITDLLPDHAKKDCETVFARYCLLMDRAGPAFTWYRSEARQTFDTVVFSNPFSAFGDYAGCDKAIMKRLGILESRDFLRARGTVSAALAHRTMRMA